MTIKKWKKTLIASTTILAIGASAGFAYGRYDKMIPATYGVVKFVYNDEDVTRKIESLYGTPGFISEDRSYIPVRAIAETMGLKVKWDHPNRTAYITDAQKAILEEENQKLEKKVKELEVKLGKCSETESLSFKELERKLNLNYGECDGVQFDIVMKGDERRATIHMDIDQTDRRQELSWKELSEYRLERFLDDLTELVLNEYPEIDIDGNIYDKFSKRDVATFRRRYNGRLIVNKELADSSMLSSMSKRLIGDKLFEIGKLSYSDFDVDVLDESYGELEANVTLNRYRDISHEKLEEAFKAAEKEFSKDNRQKFYINVYLKDVTRPIGYFYRGVFTEKLR